MAWLSRPVCGGFACGMRAHGGTAWTLRHRVRRQGTPSSGRSSNGALAATGRVAPHTKRNKTTIVVSLQGSHCLPPCGERHAPGAAPRQSVSPCSLDSVSKANQLLFDVELVGFSDHAEAWTSKVHMQRAVLVNATWYDRFECKCRGRTAQGSGWHAGPPPGLQSALHCNCPTRQLPLHHLPSGDSCSTVPRL